MPDNLEFYLSSFSALTVLTLGLLQWRSAARVQRADASLKIGDAYGDLLDRLKERTEQLEERVKYLEKELKKYTNWSARLVKQLVDHGIEPVLPYDTDELIKYQKGKP